MRWLGDEDARGVGARASAVMGALSANGSRRGGVPDARELRARRRWRVAWRLMRFRLVAVIVAGVALAALIGSDGWLLLVVAVYVILAAVAVAVILRLGSAPNE